MQIGSQNGAQTAAWGGLRHPCLVGMLACYHDAKNVYMLLEPCLGGELFVRLEANRSGMPEDAVRFCAAWVGLRLERGGNELVASWLLREVPECGVVPAGVVPEAGT